MYVNSCGSANTGSSICRSPQENVANEFVLSSPAGLRCVIRLRGFVRWEVSGCTAAVLWSVQIVLWSVASRMCSR